MKNLVSLLIVLFLSVTACKKNQSAENKNTADLAIPSDSITAIAKEAWTYGFPMFYNYKTIYANAIDKNSKVYTGFNKFNNVAKSATPADTLVVTINNDTPYSAAPLNLSDEPVILEVPKIESDRYYVMQLVDLYTFNFEYVGTRATGNNAGKYLIAGPNWKGETPKGIDKVLRSETDLIFLLGRTQLHSPADIPTLKKIQAQYKLIPLHEYTNQPAPPVKKYNMPFPEWNEAEYSGVKFINFLNALLQYTSEDSSEKDVRARFAKIGIVPGTPYDVSKFSPETVKAIEKGIAEAKKEIESGAQQLKDARDFFGTRAMLKNNYLNRAIGTASGLYGNTKDEAIYIGTTFDKDNQPLSGDKNYVLKFTKDQLPEAKYFWSITMYSLPKRFLVPNPIERYSIGNTTKGLKYEPNGDLIIYMQSTSPGKDKESNWLPTPKNQNFNFFTRLYGPKPDVINYVWKMQQPEVAK